MPKSHQPRQPTGAYAEWYGRSRTGPSHRFQSSVDGTGGGPADPLLPQFSRAIRPDVDLAHFADYSRLNPFVRQSCSLRRVPLISHRRDDTRRVRRLRQLAAFVQRVRERLLTIDVLARLDGRH